MKWMIDAASLVKISGLLLRCHRCCGRARVLVKCYGVRAPAPSSFFKGGDLGIVRPYPKGSGHKPS